MKKWYPLAFVLCVFAAGCTYEGQDLKTYLEDPATIIQDPHFMGYKEKRDNIESEYLHKKITYAEYVEQTEKLDAQYNQEVEERNAVISSD